MSNVNETFKNYPFRRELYELLKSTIDCNITMLGDYIGRYNYWLGKIHTQEELNKPIYGDRMLYGLSYQQLVEIISQNDICVCIDSYLHHAAALHGKRSVVILGPWKEEQVGYYHNINLSTPEQYQSPYLIYGESQAYQIPPQAFPSPEVVVSAIKQLLEEISNEQ